MMASYVKNFRILFTQKFNYNRFNRIGKKLSGKNSGKEKMITPAGLKIKTQVISDEKKESPSYLSTKAQNFDSIYNEYGNMIYTYLLHQVSDKETANDLFQDVMLKILKSVKKYQATGSFKSWLIVIARNHLLDHRRKKNRWRKLISPGMTTKDLEERQNGATVIPITSPVRHVEAEENQRRINSALLQLPAEQREAIDLHYNCDLSLKQMSVILDCSINTVASRVRYGLKKLKKLLEV